MKIIAVNGSARKNWNTHILLSKALKGAASAGAQTELINLYDLDYKGCTGCLGCKVKGSKSLGRCVVNDDLKSVLDRIDKSDGLILGSPIYLGDITAMLRAFWERFIFQYLSYDGGKSYFTGNLKTAFIYTMNGSESVLDQYGYTDKFQSYDIMLKMFFGNATHMVSTETLQVTDYSKYLMAGFNEAERKERREKVFPDDCRKAYELGKSMASAEGSKYYSFKEGEPYESNRHQRQPTKRVEYRNPINRSTKRNRICRSGNEIGSALRPQLHRLQELFQMQKKRRTVLPLRLEG